MASEPTENLNPAGPLDGTEKFHVVQRGNSRMAMTGQLIGAAVWGNVGGVLADQADLTAVLAGKLNFTDNSVNYGAGAVAIAAAANGMAAMSAGDITKVAMATINSGTAALPTEAGISVDLANWVGGGFIGGLSAHGRMEMVRYGIVTGFEFDAPPYVVDKRIFYADLAAVGDGVADDHAAIAAADAIGPFRFHRGSFLVGASLTIASDVEFMPGALLVVPAGVTVTINGSVRGPVDRLFNVTAGGVVVLDAGKNAERYVEWWGAAETDDCGPAFAQAVTSGTVTKCQARDYVISATLAIPAYAKVKGAGHNYEGVRTATRLLMASAANTIVQLGSTAAPVDLNSAPAGAALEDIYVGRNTAPAAGAIGILVGWSRFARLHNVRSAESVIGYRFANSIHCEGTFLFAKRSVAIAGGGADQFYAYDVDGTGALPAAGGNASLYLTDTQAELNIAIADSIAYRLHGRITDTFISRPETLGFSYDLSVEGDAGGAPTDATNTDIVIDNPKFDQSTVRSINITSLNKWGSIEIANPYIGPTSGEALRATSCDGHISVQGGQIRMGNSTAAAIIFDGCRNPVVHKPAIAECRAQAVVLNNVVGGHISPVTINCTQALSAAVQSIAGVTDATIEPYCQGDAAKVSYGLQSLDVSNNYNCIRRTGMTRGVVGTKISLAVGAEANSVNEGVA